MGAAILYGGYTLLFGTTTRVDATANAVAAADLKAMVREMRTSVAKEHPSELDMYKIALAEGTEIADPFLKVVLSDSDVKAQDVLVTTNSTDFTYSGFVKLGSRRLAIVNGEEFGVGERLNEEGCFVVAIGEDALRLERPETAGGMREHIIVPITEDTITFTEDRDAQRTPQH
jgi:hypothetical protein